MPSCLSATCIQVFLQVFPCKMLKPPCGDELSRLCLLLRPELHNDIAALLEQQFCQALQVQHPARHTVCASQTTIRNAKTPAEESKNSKQ